MARSTRELRIRRHRRVRKNLAGTTERPRVAVSRTNKHISAQIINDETGHTVAAASSVEKVTNTSLIRWNARLTVTSQLRFVGAPAVATVCIVVDQLWIGSGSIAEAGRAQD